MKKISFTCEVIVDTVSDGKSIKKRVVDLLSSYGMVDDLKFTEVEDIEKGSLIISSSEDLMRYLKSTHLIIPDVVATDPNVMLSAKAMMCFGILARSCDYRFKTNVPNKILQNMLSVNKDVISGFIRLFKNKGWITSELVEGLNNKHRQITVNYKLFEI